MEELVITRPDDWHLHLRDGTALPATVNATARVFRRAIVMPNLVPPVTTADDARAYRERILAALEPRFSGFDPLMTLYLTDRTRPEEIDRAVDSGIVYGVKLYPAGATTNSDSGVTDIAHCQASLERMSERGLPLLVHGEVTDADIDIFDREAEFIDRILDPLLERIPGLKVVFEHITTRQAADFVASGPERLAATITAHHLLYQRNHLLAGGIRPHYYCLPVLKREEHRQALVAAATGGNPRFFLGTDSAPHEQSAKESACGCAGIFTAHAALELYAEVFDAAGALDRLEAFASHNGADFYGLPRNADTVRLRRDSWQVPDTYDLDDTRRLVPLRAGETVGWRIAP
jgi:dihydroorotase